MCAICLGLGGLPSSLARMDSLKGFIKEGETEASVEVELFAAMTGNPDDGNRCIRRTFRADKSTFHELTPSSSGRGWREHEVTAKRVKELMASFDVDVDNLCVLLAQDRVGKFAEMKPTERLVETEKAANMEYYHQHRRLIDLRKEEKDYEKTVVALTRSLDGKQSEVDAMEPEMKRREERKEEEEKMATMKKKRPWVEYREHEHRSEAVKEERDRLHRQVEEEKERQGPLKSVLLRATKEWKAADKTKGEVETAATRLDAQRKELVASLRALTSNVEAKQQEVRKLARDEKDFEADLQQRAQRLATQAEVVRQLPDLSEAKAQLQRAREANVELARESHAVKGDILGLQRDIGDLQLEVTEVEGRRLQRRQRAQNRAETLFRKVNSQKHRGEFDVVKVAKERQRQHRVKLDSDPHYVGAEQRQRMNDSKSDAYVLKGEVYGPLVLEVEYKEEQVGTILENLFNFHKKMMYVCSERDDWTWLVSRVSMVACRPNTQSKKLSPEALRQRVDLRRFDSMQVAGYIFDAISAAPLVMNFLVEEVPITTTPYFRRELTADELNQIIPAEKPPNNAPWIRALFTPQHEHAIRFSRYGAKDRSVTDRLLEKAKLFSQTAEDEGEGEEQKVAELKAQIQAKEAELAEVRKKEEALARRFAAVSQERDKWDGQVRKDKAERDRLAQYRRELDALQKDASSHAKRERLQREIAKSQQLQVARIGELVKVETEWVDAQMHVDVWTLQAQHKLSEKTFIENKASAAGLTLRRLVDDWKKKEDEYHRVQQHVGALRAAAQRECMEEEVLGLEWLPDRMTLDELDDLIHEKQLTIEALHGADEGDLIARYEQARKDVEVLTAQLQTKEAQHATHSQLIAQYKAEWLTSIRELVQHLHASFSLYFRRLHHVGEVVLVEHNDFDQYEIRIRVDFHSQGDKSHLTDLSHTFQSGGEKSVTTMLYLLTLQEVTNAPFRIVDEINQGMDPKNEEKIFNQIVHASAQYQDHSLAIRLAGARAARGEDALLDDGDGKEEKEEAEAGAGGQKGKALGAPQYIVLSPKLLPDLEMPEEVGLRVIVMMGGAMGEESAAKERKTGGSALAWEQPMKVVQHADHWLSQRQVDDGLSQLFDSQTDSSASDDSEEDAEAVEEEEEEERKEDERGRGRRGGGRAKGESSSVDLGGNDDEVEVIVALSRELREDPLYHSYG